MRAASGIRELGNVVGSRSDGRGPRNKWESSPGAGPLWTGRGANKRSQAPGTGQNTAVGGGLRVIIRRFWESRVIFRRCGVMRGSLGGVGAPV